MSLGKIALVCVLLTGTFVAALIYMTSDATERTEMEEELRKNNGKGLKKPSAKGSRSSVKFPPKGRSRKYAHELLAITWPEGHQGRQQGNLVLSLRGNGSAFHQRSMMAQAFMKSQLGVAKTSKVLEVARAALSAEGRTAVAGGFAVSIDDELGKLKGQLSESEVKTVLQEVKGSTKPFTPESVTLKLVPLDPAASPMHPEMKWPLSTKLYDSCIKEPTEVTGTSAHMKLLLQAAAKGQALKSGAKLHGIGSYEVHVPKF